MRHAAGTAGGRTAGAAGGRTDGRHLRRGLRRFTLSAVVRERAGAGCDVTATQGAARIAGCDDGPQVAYAGPAMGTLGNPRARRIEPGGQADSCN